MTPARTWRALKDLVTANPEDLLWDLHLMASLGDILHPAVPPLLAARFGGSPDKARRKALKRVLHLLKTRGVPVPGDLLPREEPAVGPAQPPAVKSPGLSHFGQRRRATSSWKVPRKSWAATSWWPSLTMPRDSGNAIC